MKAYKFITTFSNIQKKFDVVAYPRELKFFFAKVKLNTIYTEVPSFGGSQPVKYKIYNLEGYRFYSKIFFLGNRGTIDTRGGNYMATTIAVLEGNLFNPARLFLNDKIWSEGLTEQEDHAYAKDPFLPAEEIELNDNKYDFIRKHARIVPSYFSRLLQLIGQLIEPHDRDILLNSSRGDYSKLFFFAMDILPEEFTYSITITLHAGDPDKETANLIETVEYGLNKIDFHKKRFAIIDNYNSEEVWIDHKDVYLQFLQKALAGPEIDIERIQIFNELYGYLQFKERNFSSLHLTTDIINGNLKLLFDHFNNNEKIDFLKIACLLLKSGIISLKEWLENALDTVFFSKENPLDSYINHAINIIEYGDLSLADLISIYEKKRGISAGELIQLVLTHWENPLFDSTFAKYLLTRMKPAKDQDSSEELYTEALASLRKMRKDLFENDSTLKQMWEEHEEELEIKDSDNPGYYIRRFNQYLIQYKKPTNWDKAIKISKDIFEKPWKPKSLQKVLKSLKKNIPKQALIADFIFEFLTYLDQEKDVKILDAHFLLQRIIGKIPITDKDGYSLLHKLCEKRKDTVFSKTIESEIKNRFTQDDASKLLSLEHDLPPNRFGK